MGVSIKSREREEVQENCNCGGCFFGKMWTRF